LDWRAKVELFEQIRREYEFGIGTIVGVAKKLGVHRRIGARGDRERVAKAAEETGPSEMEAEDGRSSLWAAILEAGRKAAAQTAAYRAPHLDADAAGAA
jgi:hypothetical protein